MTHQQTVLEQPINFAAWLEEAKPQLQPPVCNKLTYGGQLKVMVVGGPNSRTDYHIEEGEELFYQVKGDMLLKVMEQGKPKDIAIKEGEMFLLPPRIPHSPQRFADTIGIVIEREREESKEFDIMRWYVDNSVEILYEECFHCFDLGVQLKPVIERFRASPQYRTGKPSSDGEGIVKNPPLIVDVETETESPKNVQQWLNSNAEKLRGSCLDIFNGTDFTVSIIGPEAQIADVSYPQETFYYQTRGSSVIETTDQGQVVLPTDSMIIIPPNVKHSSKHSQDSSCWRLVWHKVNN